MISLTNADCLEAMQDIESGSVDMVMADPPYQKPACAWNLTDLDDIPKNGINVFSTFSCGGGSTMGYKLAGCDVVGGCDIDKDMAYHYKLNHKPKHFFTCSIKTLNQLDNLPQELFELDILDGSPPCSTFSMVGSREKAWGKNKKFREGQAKQVLDNLFFDYLDLVEKLKPRVAIAENVKGLIQGNAKGYVKLIMKRFREIGYRPQLFLINAVDCGVPQRRERVFFCAVRDDLPGGKLALSPKHRWVSAGEACVDLQVLTMEEINDVKATGTDLRFWGNTKKGDSYKKASLIENGKRSFFSQYRLSDEIPSCTLSSKGSNYTHWNELRGMTFREWKRLGSFPDDYKARTDKIGKYMIGMSVPPRMMEQVARAVIEQWLK